MSSQEPLTVLVLSEDSGVDGRAAVRNVVERLVVSWADGKKVLEVDDASPSPAAAYANLWRSRARKDYPESVRFLRRLATELGAGKVVIFHYDGDTSWEGRATALTKHQFAELRVRLSQLLPEPSAQRCLLEMVPHYSIEAWAYQATDAALQLCADLYEGRDAGLFRGWGENRAVLDEIERPKDQTALHAKHNADLTRRIPAAEVVLVGKSLAAFVRALVQLPELSVRVRAEVRANLALVSGSGQA